MSFNFLNDGRSDDTATKFQPIDTFIDPVSKIRVSNPGNLIDTDFEYGLQPTKWETVEIINNTPAFFSKSGDTTISDITGITTNAGTREITVTTAFPHLLDVGIPIRVSGTRSLTADGSYIINATPTPTTFTYLSRANQAETVSIFDLYSSIITGEFFQGSQISISDSEGITTDGIGPNSTLTVKTSNKHGFGPNTPFYFLNLNSTVSQEFESQNSTSLSFDPTNSATAQTFDGSNTLIQTPINLSNSGTTSIYQNSITSTDVNNATVTVSIQQGDEEKWLSLKYGDPLYYDVTVGTGYFQSNPKGVVFIKSVENVDATLTLTATFQVSERPDGDALPILSNMTGYFQIADQAKTFAGNNIDPQSQIDIGIEVGEEFFFDGGNQGYAGNIVDPPASVGTVVGYTGTTVSLFTSEGDLDYYVGAMVQYNTDGASATGLSAGSSYFVTSFQPGHSAGLYTMSIAEFPGESNIDISGGSGTQTFAKIGVSTDKDIVHIKDSNFEENDMIEYASYPEAGEFLYSSDNPKKFFFIATAYDSHNYVLRDEPFAPTPTWNTQEGRLFRESPGIYTTQSYSTTLSAEFTDSFSIVSGSLPAGLSLNTATGQISGTPTGVASFVSNVVSNFTIRATNQNGFADQSFNVRVDSYEVGRSCLQLNEGNGGTVTAPSGFIFTRVSFTSYGTPGGSCPNFSRGGCHTGGRPGQLAVSAYPRTSVYVAATNGAFGDPCGGTYKRYRGAFVYSPINP